MPRCDGCEKGSLLQAVTTQVQRENHLWSREKALESIIKELSVSSLVVSTTGMLSRELYELREELGSKHTDLLCVGGMGHSVAIAVGVARAKPDANVVCLDGDGAVLMHAGNLTLAAKTPNIIHVVFNNKSHDSVGGQETCDPSLKFIELARAVGYEWSFRVASKEDVQNIFKQITNNVGSVFIEVDCKRGAKRAWEA